MGVQEERWECGRRGGSAGGEVGVRESGGSAREVGVWEERWECGRKDGSAR